jgi:hypothetical protein
MYKNDRKIMKPIGCLPLDKGQNPNNYERFEVDKTIGDCLVFIDESTFQLKANMKKVHILRPGQPHLIM